VSIVLDLTPTASNGTNVNTLTPAVGTTLVNRGNSQFVAANLAHRAQGSSNGNMATNQVLASPDYRVYADLVWLGSETNAGFRLWMRSPDANNGIQLLMFGGSLSIRSVQASSGTNLTGGTATFSFSPASCELMLEGIGQNFKGYINGVERVSGTTSLFPDAAAAAWRTEGDSLTPDVTTVGWHIARYRVEMLGGGSSITAIPLVNNGIITSLVNGGLVR
jgi:hypothetical protein